MNKIEYSRFCRPYSRVLRQLLLDLEFFIEDFAGINIYAVTHRLKTFESAIEKSKRLNLKINKMQDIGGIRIVVASLDEVDVIARFFSRKADSKDLIVKSDKIISKNDGYRARHLVLEFSGHYSRSMYPSLIEVQILTILQSTFNYISRAWIYKANRELPPEWKSNFEKLSIDLADIDRRITLLQKQIIESSVSNDSLTPFSLQQIITDIFGESIDINNAVDMVSMLIDVGCDTNGKLINFFQREDILNLRKQILNIDSETGKDFGNFIARMPIYSFYTMFGMSIDSTKELIKKLSQTKQNRL